MRLRHHREDCTDEEAAAIVSSLAGRVESVLITYLAQPDEIDQLARTLGVGWVQLHGKVEPSDVALLRTIAPGLGLAKSLIVRPDDPEAPEREMHAHAPNVDAFLTDSFDPATGAEGATGRTHDWAISRALAQESAHPLVLAGGLTPENVRDAIVTVRPAAVDAHTGVEGPDGRKDRDRVARFVAEARAGFAAIGQSATSSA